MAKGESRSRRISASTRRLRERPSSSATRTTSRSGSPDAGAPASPESRPISSATSGTSGSSGNPIVRGPEGRAPRLAHEQVLLAEVLAQLDPHEAGRYLDGTVGAGGHAAAVLERSGPSGKLLGIDRDPEALAAAAKELARFGDRAVLVRANLRVFTTWPARTTSHRSTASSWISGSARSSLPTKSGASAFAREARWICVPT